MIEFLGFPLSMLAIIAVATFATAVIHGATGMAGGILLAAIFAHPMGIKQAIPLTTCILLFSHGARVYFNFREIDWQCVKIVLLFSTPTIIAGAVIFSYLPAAAIALLMAAVLALSFPIKAWARHNNLKTSPSVLAGASSFWGLLAGNVIGPGFVLAPFLLGTGMNRLAFVGSLASIVLCMNALKIVVFGMTNLMTLKLFVLGVIIGLITIPANWLGRQFLHSMTDQYHARLIDLMTVLVIINFLYLAFI